MAGSLVEEGFQGDKCPPLLFLFLTFHLRVRGPLRESDWTALVMWSPFGDMAGEGGAS